MRRTLAALALIAALTAPALGKKKIFPRLIATAQYVFITDARGNQFGSRMTPEDRAAVERVRRAIRVWERYTDVDSAEQADIILVVRAAHIGGAHHGGVIVLPIPGSGQGPQTGTTGGMDTGSSVDMLSVYRTDVNGAPLWQAERDGGLNSPGVPLVQDLRKEVEQSDADEKQKKP